MHGNLERLKATWRRQALVTVAFLPVFLTIGFWDSEAVVGLPYRLNGILGLCILAAFLFFTWRNWRCPECSTRLPFALGATCMTCALV
jgi:hypothetical protein